MAREFIAIPNQIVQPNSPVLFESEVNRGLLYHLDGSGQITLASPSLMGVRYGCTCRSMPLADWLIEFHGNVQIPEGGTVDEISLSIVSDGDIDAGGIMRTTPTAAEVPENVGAGIIASIPWICRCKNVSVRNTGTEPIQIVNGGLIVSFAGIRR